MKAKRCLISAIILSIGFAMSLSTVQALSQQQLEVNTFAESEVVSIIGQQGQLADVTTRCSAEALSNKIASRIGVEVSCAVEVVDESTGQQIDVFYSGPQRNTEWNDNSASEDIWGVFTIDWGQCVRVTTTAFGDATIYPPDYEYDSEFASPPGWAEGCHS